MTVPSTAATGAAAQPPERRGGRALRVASGLLVVGLAGGALAGAAHLGVASAVPVLADEVEVAPTPVTLQCPGPVVLPQRAERGDAAFDPSPVAPDVTLGAVTAAGSGAGGLAVLPLDGEAAVLDLEAGGGAVHLGDVAAPLVVRAQPLELSPVVAATGASVVTDGDARGLAAASCRAPGNDEWFVGGSTAVGATATLVLTNPGLTAAQVELELFGPNGPVEPTTRQHVVAPGATKVVDLGGAAADQAAVVVHVTVAGGLVAAHVQDTAVRGFTPAGTDLVVPGVAPSTRQVVTGLVAPESEVGSADAPALRLLAPGDAATTARVTLLGADGPVDLPGAQRVPLVAGEVTDVPLGGLPAGVYTVVVDADAPVVAGAVVSRTGAPGALDDEPRVERAWSPSTTPGGHGTVAIPRGVQAHVVIGAVGRSADDTDEGAATLRVLGGDGEVLSEHRVRVDAGTTGAWDVAELGEGAVAVELEPGDGVPLAWAVALTVQQDDGPLVATLAPVPVVDVRAALAVRQDARLARG
ncbi:DUF5719 family protein [Cellulomonas xiejunii]|uniref:DUF5719 family protein n=1 Tax=Cellulomonas xiejunii TaxID=2968083 RepID=A0ABY5KQ93_9CELL|nr:DUF5719 family protein [Cellulomonas xiejunii]MCC2312945.1 DUF5719 family protein [Cellulomonas xiejunii]MCC2320185.1 DUF5719 family protein [Cellulomonas xiejunii]UUI70493.1 DUF5719 family protein [Cellulomonas xiejunii]